MSFKKVKIKNLVTLTNGHAFKPDDWGVAGKRIIRIQNLNNPEASYNLTKKEVPEKYVVRKGDILIAWAGSLGVYEWEQEENALLNQHLFKVEFKTTDIDKSYFKYVIYQALTELKHKARGVGLKHLKKGQIEDYEFSLPNKEVQEKSVSLLNHLIRLIKKREQTHSLLDEYLHSIFLQMFGDPIENPKNWPLIPLSELISGINSGWSPVCENYSRSNITEWAVLKQGAVTKKTFLSSENKKLPKERESEAQLKPVASIGDVLFSRKNTKELVGSSAYIYEKCNKLIIPDTIFQIDYEPQKLNGIYLTYLLNDNNFSKKIKRLATGSVRSMVNIAKLKLTKVLIPVPDKKRYQDVFGKIGQQVYTQKELSKKSLELLQNLLQSLVYATFSSKRTESLDLVDNLMEDDIRTELFLNTIKSSDFENEELYIKAIDDLFEILDRTQQRNQSDPEYLKGIIQRINDKEIILETNKENKYRLSDEAATN